MIPLTGTTSAEHMRDDLSAIDIELSAEERQSIESVAVV
jgi:aryl-alcohol dehydrogenase-like predicted oxidoreductase